MIEYPYVVTVSSEKGGVGKTTLAVNLAIFLKALNEDLPVSILSFDNHFTIDRMFEIRSPSLTGDVADFIKGTAGADLLHTGQYGVDYIPSSRTLNEVKHHVKGSLALARSLATSRMPGILIIDTRPDLDILTQNALFAADRVLIPVKDLASLENCRNIFDLFEKKGLDKKGLSLIPCLIDSRIKFEGPFHDQRALLKGYAINRGYRCLDMFISKSPKVESLGTNPSGKVYPILTHARHTEVYGQFAQLAREVMADFSSTASPRSLQFHKWLASEEERSRVAFSTRRKGMRSDCLLCKRRLSDGPNAGTGFYYESSDGAAAGFLHEDCFSDILLSSIFDFGKRLAVDDPKRRMLKEAMNGSIFVFNTFDNESEHVVECSRFDRDGNQLSKKLCPLREHEGGFLNREKSGLFQLVSETISTRDGQPGKAFLLVHPTRPEDPEAILHDVQYRELALFKRQIARHLEGQELSHQVRGIHEVDALFPQCG